MMKLRSVTPYVKMMQKIYKLRGTALEFCKHQHFFHWKLVVFVISGDFTAV